MKKNALYCYFIFTLIAFIGCTSTAGRVRDFVEHYNDVAFDQFSPAFSKVNNIMVKRTYASTIPSKNPVGLDIKIVFVSGFALKDPATDIYKKFIPLAFSNYISNNKEAKYLIERGIKFIVIYASRTEKQISELIIDKSNFQQLLKEKPGQNLEMGKENRNTSIKPEVKQLLITLNNSLPLVVDKVLETKIIKIDLNSLNDLVYTVEVGDEMEKALAQKGAGETIKGDILKNPKISNFYFRMKGLGLADIRYVYVNRSGKKLTDILITREDLK